MDKKRKTACYQIMDRDSWWFLLISIPVLWLGPWNPSFLHEWKTAKPKEHKIPKWQISKGSNILSVLYPWKDVLTVCPSVLLAWASLSPWPAAWSNRASTVIRTRKWWTTRIRTQDPMQQQTVLPEDQGEWISRPTGNGRRKKDLMVCAHVLLRSLSPSWLSVAPSVLQEEAINGRSSPKVCGTRKEEI